MGPRSEFEVQIEGDINLKTESGNTLWISSEQYKEARAEIESLMGSTVTSATVDDSGLLNIKYDSNVELDVPADDDYEAWNVVGPRGYRVACLPGGELATWSAKD